MKLTLLLSLSFLLFSARAQPATVSLTPVVNTPSYEVMIDVPEKFSGSFPEGITVNVPLGYKARVFYVGGLNKPRFMSFSPSGVLHVSDMNTGGAGKIYALPDEDQDGVADTAMVASQGYGNNHDVKFYNGAMYVTETTKVWKCLDNDQDGVYDTKDVFIDSLSWQNSGTGHYTRTIVFDGINHKAYVSIGSSCNVCRENDRALIEQYNDDGTARRIYATGVRNAVGMGMHPVTNTLWANNNGSDNQGNELPPEWVDIVRDQGFYGHPFAYGDSEWFNFDSGDYASLKPIVANDSMRVESMIEPAARLRAHSAPMALQFLNTSFPSPMRKGFLVALHGSWNTASPNDYRGYKVVYAHPDNDQDTAVDYVSDFCSGFITDTVNRVYWGRPVGLAINNDGAVFISSDEVNKAILIIYPETGTGIKNIPRNIIQGNSVFPNPFQNSFTLQFTATESANVNATLYNILGNEVKVLVNELVNVGEYKKEFNMGNITPGLYIIRIKAGEQVITQKINCIR